MTRSSCVALLALLVLAAHCHHADAKVVTIRWAVTKYAPVTIKLGDSLKFTWAVGTHGVAVGSCKVYKVLRKLAPKATFTTKPAKKGTFTYVCQNALHCARQQLKVKVI